MSVASARRPDAGTLVPQQQGNSLELRAHGRRHAAALGSRLDLTDGSGECRDDIATVVDASLLPQCATASARLALAWSGHRLLLWNAGTRWPRQHAARSYGRGEKRPEQRPSALNTEPTCGSLTDRRRPAPAGQLHEP